MVQGFGARLLAWVKKEVPAGDLEAFRASGNGVHDLLLAADRRRDQLALEGRDLWTAPPGAQAELLSIWCADALQTLGDTYLQAAYDADPPPAGHVPELIHAETLAFYHRVETWVIRARKAAASPGYRLRARLPDSLPAWTERDSCPPEHLHALLAAARALGEKASVAVSEAERSAPLEHRHHCERLRQLREGADTKVELARGLIGRYPLSIALRRRVEERLRTAIAEYYHLGQFATLPNLLDRQGDRSAPPPKKPKGRRSRRRRRR